MLRQIALLVSVIVPGIAAGERGVPPEASPPPDLHAFRTPAGIAADALQPDGGDAGKQYLFITGSALHRKDNNTLVNSAPPGCVTSNGWMVADLQLPDGAILEGMRAYYHSDDNLDGMVSITRNNGAGAQIDLASGVLFHTMGWTSTYFQLIVPEAIDHLSYSYVLQGWAPNGMQLCGLRVAYSLP